MKTTSKSNRPCEHFNREHPGFDRELELLCSLPCENENGTAGARLATLVDDLGYTSQQGVDSVQDGIRRLWDAHGFRVSTQTLTVRDEDGYELRTRIAFVCYEGWDAAKVTGNDYWDKLYGNGAEQ